MKMRGMLLLILAMSFMLLGEVDAIATTVSYQGALHDGSGNPLPDGDYGLTFKIWSDSTGGSMLWSESQTIYVSDSFFDVYLGADNPINDDVFAIGGGSPDPSNRYLEITVGTEVLTPRRLLAAVPYSSVARRLNGDIFTNEGRLAVRNIVSPTDSATVNIAADSSGSSIRMIGGGNPDPSNSPQIGLITDSFFDRASFSMIGGGNPDPSDLARIDLSADSVQSSLFAIGGGNPDPGQSPNIGILAETDQASLIIMGIVSPNDSPLVNIAADSNGSSIRMVGGGTPDPSDVSLELRSAAHDSARISIQVGSASMGIEMRNSSDQITAQLSGNGLGLFVDAGSSSAAPIGTRFRDNAVVAWGNVQAGGSLASDFGVLSVSHPSSGQYTITLNNSAASLDNLIPTAIAEVSAIPVTATAARLLTVNQLTPNSFAVYITTGGYTPIDNNFVFMVTAR